MDTIGVGSLPIVLLTGMFSGAVMALRMGRALGQYGQTGRVGTVVSIILVRELGPVLTSVMVAGRNSSGIASELGSMKVTEQIDAMRALGTDPVQKLVTPRMIATALDASLPHRNRRFRRHAGRLGHCQRAIRRANSASTGRPPGKRSTGATWCRGW